MIDTATKERRDKRLEELVEGYKKTGNKIVLVRIVGGSVEDWGDYSPADAGEPPKGAYEE